MFRMILALWIVLGLISSFVMTPTQAVTGETITNYYSPCGNGLQGFVSTWHSANQDGTPPLDPERRTFDFRCPDKKIYAPHGGIVQAVTPRFGGVILIWDQVNQACMVFLGMHEIAVELNQAVDVGAYLGRYGHAFHLSALDINCEQANFYDHHARAYERPVVWMDIGYEMAADITRHDPVYFISLNPGGKVYRLPLIGEITLG